ncbi:MAG: hypothetical protein GX079_07165, partial [Tissierellia bacterium]|nr:hypothetical protein [Tissierellia bacterium]
MNEEIKKILKMIEEGHITADEGQRLIEALGAKITETNESSWDSTNKKAKFLKVRVAEEGKDIVNISLPIGLVEVGLKLGTKIGKKHGDIEGLENIDFDEIIEAVRGGAQGKLVDVEDGDTKVEVFV